MLRPRVAGQGVALADADDALEQALVEREPAAVLGDDPVEVAVDPAAAGGRDGRAGDAAVLELLELGLHVRRRGREATHGGVPPLRLEPHRIEIVADREDQRERLVEFVGALRALEEGADDAGERAHGDDAVARPRRPAAEPPKPRGAPPPRDPEREEERVALVLGRDVGDVVVVVDDYGEEEVEHEEE